MDSQVKIYFLIQSNLSFANNLNGFCGKNI